MATPRERFRAYLESGDKRWILPALAGSGLAHMASQVIVAFTDEEMQARTAGVPISAWYTALLLWPIATLVASALNAALLGWTGRWLGGQATRASLLVAIGWSVMPVALTAPLVTAEAIALLRGASNPGKAGGLAGVAESITGWAFAVTAIMSILRLIISVSEAQRFSKMRAAGNFVLAGLPFFMVALALVLTATGIR
ncbi:MAG TPA: YIP1 family protein [Myxococcales bacterium]|nr:YIP1 family protein [Myxococcales bacterium]